MTTIISIIHCRFELVPPVDQPTSIEQLYQLTVLTNKYLLTGILRPWATTWLSSVIRQSQSGSTVPCTYQHERLSWIAWEMGDPQLFTKSAELLAHHCSIAANGDLCYYNTPVNYGGYFTLTIKPPGIDETVRAFRLEYIKRALEIYRLAFEELRNPYSRNRAYGFCAKGG
ncbi:hypothetical protein F5B22DRAFT_601049 [Xylaria bambusicola]|uniref:uncharacterized protein n=1 Tax=Xylaria bambusicola TaxID=326684 RepID=UPI00200831DC|nr:uncharacterized protein F5B22DRAFT_601049 [Xylaria bambusicola]KAI0517922.1 hypothetical protein F5B22DRAFT_601049 [Xylaria bambusicola]